MNVPKILSKNYPVKKQCGFTLIELVLVIVLLGVIVVGSSGIIRFASQTFVNVSERDELVSNARFVLERLNREIRNALPSSILITNNGRQECIRFTPIIASSHYLTIPINPTSANSITVIPFKNRDGTNYTCNNCGDSVIINPLNNNDVYTNNLKNTGQIFLINNINTTNDIAPNRQWQLNLTKNVSFNRASPAARLYIINSYVEYCHVASLNQLYRFEFSPVYDDANDNVATPVRRHKNFRPLMANNVRTFDNNPPFVFDNANLTRNGVVKIDLEFYREDTDNPSTQEKVVFNHEIHIKNTP